jgi:polygalacturonase
MPPLLALLSLLVAVLLGSAPISVVSAPAPLMTSVKSFGAVGDGANDDGPAIQRAMNATGVQNGSGTVYFPAGTYRINAPLVWTCRRLLGESNFASVLWAGQPMSAVLV